MDISKELMRFSFVIRQIVDMGKDCENELHENFDKLRLIVSELEKLTWLNSDGNESLLMDISNILLVGRGLISQFNENIKKLEPIAAGYMGIYADFVEAMVDLDVVFFKLPYDKKFKEATEKLSKLLRE